MRREQGGGDDAEHCALRGAGGIRLNEAVMHGKLHDEAGDGQTGANENDGEGARQAANPKQRPVDVFNANGDADAHRDKQGERGEQGAGVVGHGVHVGLWRV